MDGPSGSSAIHHLDTLRAPYHDVHRVTASTPPISMDGRHHDGRSGSSTTHHLDTSNALHVASWVDQNRPKSGSHGWTGTRHFPKRKVKGGLRYPTSKSCKKIVENQQKSLKKSIQLVLS
jgi:hypothetical protein